MSRVWGFLTRPSILTVQGRVWRVWAFVRGVGFFGAELVKIVVVGGLVEGRLRVGDGVLGGDGLELGLGGVDVGGGPEAGDGARGEGAEGSGGSGVGGSGEEAAAAGVLLLVLAEGGFGGDLGGAGLGA